MSVLKNVVMLTGRLGSTPESTKLENGKRVVNLSIATSETYLDKDNQKQTITDWHNIVFWDGVADLVEKYCNKGDKVSIMGKLKHSSYEKDGVTTYRTFVLVKEIEFHTPPPSSENA